MSRNSLFGFLSTIEKCKNSSFACRWYKNQRLFRAGLQTTVCVPPPPPQPQMATVPIIRTISLHPSYDRWNYHSEVRTANPITPVLPVVLLTLQRLSDAFHVTAPDSLCSFRHPFRFSRLHIPWPSQSQLLADSINTFLTSCSLLGPECLHHTLVLGIFLLGLQKSV